MHTNRFCFKRNRMYHFLIKLSNLLFFITMLCNQSTFNCRPLRKPAHQQLYQNPRPTRDHFAVQVSNLFLKHLHKPPNTTPISTKSSHTLAVRYTFANKKHTHVRHIFLTDCFQLRIFQIQCVCIFFIFFIFHFVQTTILSVEMEEVHAPGDLGEEGRLLEDEVKEGQGTHVLVTFDP